MPIIKCLSIIKGTKLESSFAGITDKMTVSQQREMALKTAIDYHKGLHEELEGLKKSINKKHVKAKYIQPDYTEQVQRIKERDTANEAVKANEDRDFALSEVNKGAINWDNDMLTPRPELGMEWKDIRKGKQDLIDGKDTPASKRLVEAINKAKEDGGYNFIQGSGKLTNKMFIPIDWDIKKATDLTSEELKYVAENEQKHYDDYNKWLNSLTEKEFNDELNSIENGKQNKESRTVNEQTTDSKTNVSNTENVKSEGENIKQADESRTVITEAPKTFTKKVSELTAEERDAEIEALEKMLNDKVLKSKMVANFNEAATVGDVKSLFTTVPETITALKEYYSKNESMTRTLEMIEPVLEGSNVYFDNDVDFESGDVGQYDPKTGKVSININGNYGKTQILKTTVHELVHAATIHEIENNKAFARELTRVLDAFKFQKGLPESGGALLRMLEQARFEKDGKIMSFEDFYGATNIYELTAEIFTNKSFFDMLQKVEYKDYNLLRKIFETIIAFFDAGSKRVLDAKKSIGNVTNLADYIISLSEKVIEGTKTKPVEKLKYFSSKSDGEFSKSDAEARLAELKQAKNNEEVKIKDKFSELVDKNLDGEELIETASNIEREGRRELSYSEKTFLKQRHIDTFKHGEDLIEAAKEKWGDDYVGGLLSYLKEGKIKPSTNSLILISLANDINRRLIAEPENELDLMKKLELVDNEGILAQRDVARANSYGIFRQIGRVNYDADEAAKNLFSTKEKTARKKIEKVIKSTPEDLQKQAEENEQAKESELDKEFGDIIIEKPTGEKLKKAQAEVKLAEEDFMKAIRRSMGQMNSGGAFNLIGDAAKLISAYSKLGIVKIEDVLAKMSTTFGNKFVKNNEQVIRDAHQEVQNTSKEPKSKDLLQNAKDRIKERIEEKKQHIADKKFELNARDKNYTEDAEYKALDRELKQLEKLERQYLTPESKDLLDDRKKASIVKKLENELIDLDEQISNGEKKSFEAKKDPLTNDTINDLKAQKKARLALLEQIDPNPAQAVKDALISQGYGKEITVTTAQGKEKRTILDWTKLSEIPDIRNAIDKITDYLKSNGSTEVQISRMKNSIENELTTLREGIIEKSAKELDRKNSLNSNESKILARRLAELYNYGLFNKNPEQYQHLLNKVFGASLIDQEAFFKVRDLAGALSTAMASKVNGDKLSDIALSSIETDLKNKIKRIVQWAQFKEGGLGFKIAIIARELMGLMQRRLLLSLGQAIDNPASGYIQEKIDAIQDKFSKGNLSDRALARHGRMMARAIFRNVTYERGMEYGGAGSAFTTTSSIEQAINSLELGKKFTKKEANQKRIDAIYLTLVNTLNGRPYLDAADSMFKIKRTELEFTHNLIRLLTDKTNPNGAMSVDEARQMVSEKLTGQSFEDAKKVAVELVNEINEKAGKKVISDADNNILRIANDIVKDSLLQGTGLTAAEIKASFNAGYYTAGTGMGHEANNFIAMNVAAINRDIQTRLDKALRDKDFSKAIPIIMRSILQKNILSPFAGGGSNWTVLTLQKLGLPVQYILQEDYRNVRPIDLATEQGMKDLENTLKYTASRRRANGRNVIGGMSGLLLTALLIGSGKDDELAEFLRKNPKLAKYINKIMPSLMVIYLSYQQGNKEFAYQMAQLFGNKFGGMDDVERAFNLMKTAITKGALSEETRSKAGELVGGKVNMPYVPLPLVKQVGEVINEFKGKKTQKSARSTGFISGFYKNGMFDYMGFRPEAKPLTQDEINIMINEAMKGSGGK